jgi:prostaglandin-E synthase
MNIAPVKWAQRKDSLYVTITLNDVKDHKINLTNDKLTFEGNSNGKDYSLNAEFVSSRTAFCL